IPVGGLLEPWADRGTIQRRGNVWLVQNPLPCLPCDKLGCDGHLDSRAQCLDELTARQVLAAVDQALGGQALGSPARDGAGWRGDRKAAMESANAENDMTPSPAQP